MRRKQPADKAAYELALLKSRPGGRMVILAGYASTDGNHPNIARKRSSG